MTEKKNELQVILDEQGLDEANSKAIIEAFGGPFEEAGAILANFSKDENGVLVPGKTVVSVTDESDIEGMTKARTDRLILKNARTTLEKNRKELKADINKQAKAIDNVANFAKSVIEPAEKYLQLQENFAKIKQEQEAEKKRADRLTKLSGFSVDTSIYNIDLMTDEAFADLLIRLQKDVDHAAQVEQKRIELEAEEEEKRIKAQAEIQAENDRLKKEAEEKEKRNELIRDRINMVTSLGLTWIAELNCYVMEELQVSPDQIKEYKKEDFQKVLDGITHVISEKLRIKNEEESKARAKAEEDSIEREKLQKAENDRLAAEAKAKKESDEAERTKLLAPDKEKVKDYIKTVAGSVVSYLPAVKSPDAMTILNDFQHKIQNAINQAMDQVEKL